MRWRSAGAPRPAAERGHAGARRGAAARRRSRRLESVGKVLTSAGGLLAQASDPRCHGLKRVRGPHCYDVLNALSALLDTCFTYGLDSIGNISEPTSDLAWRVGHYPTFAFWL